MPLCLDAPIPTCLAITFLCSIHNMAGLAFLYLWWLGILLFDLTFVWHRYIRCSVAIDTLRQWRRNQDATPNPMMGLGPRRLAPERQAP